MKTIADAPITVKYYLLDWRDRNMEAWKTGIGKNVNDLTLQEALDAFSQCTAHDVELMADMLNPPVPKVGKDAKQIKEFLRIVQERYPLRCEPLIDGNVVVIISEWALDTNAEHGALAMCACPMYGHVVIAAKYIDGDINLFRMPLWNQGTFDERTR